MLLHTYSCATCCSTWALLLDFYKFLPHQLSMHFCMTAAGTQALLPCRYRGLRHWLPAWQCCHIIRCRYMSGVIQLAITSQSICCHIGCRWCISGSGQRVKFCQSGNVRESGRIHLNLLKVLLSPYDWVSRKWGFLGQHVLWGTCFCSALAGFMTTALSMLRHCTWTCLSVRDHC